MGVPIVLLARCDGPGRVEVKSPESGFSFFLDVSSAEQLRNQLRDAIAEAKRLNDPFEEWFESLPQAFGSPTMRHVNEETFMEKHQAKAVWDAVIEAVK